MIQSLESRVLFSSVATFLADGTQLAIDVGAARVDVAAYATALRGDVRSVGGDLHGLPKSAGNTSLLNALQADESKWSAAVRADVRSVVSAATVNGKKTITDAIHVFLHPTNLAFIARLASDLLSIGSGLSAPLAKLQADVASGRSALLTDLNNLAAANSSDAALQSNVQQIGSDSQSAIDKLTADGQTLQSDLQNLGVILGG
jgi:hypothetical protein